MCCGQCVCSSQGRIDSVTSDCCGTVSRFCELMGSVRRVSSPVLELDVVKLRTVTRCWNAGSIYWPHGETFMDCVRRVGGLHDDARGSPYQGTWAVSGDTDDDNSVSCERLSPDLGDVWKKGCPPEWESDSDVSIDGGITE